MQSYDKELFQQYLQENTNEIEDNFCISGNYVSQLVQKELHGKYTSKDTIDIGYGGLINIKIEIILTQSFFQQLVMFLEMIPEEVY
jgi:hypothetical protein